MPDRDVILQNRRMSFGADVNNRPVLDIRSGADAYVINIATEDRAKPDASVLPDHDIADNYRVVGNVSRFVDFMRDSVKGFYHAEEVFPAKTQSCKERNKEKELRYLNHLLSFRLIIPKACSSSVTRKSFATITNEMPPRAIGTKASASFMVNVVVPKRLKR